MHSWFFLYCLLRDNLRSSKSINQCSGSWYKFARNHIHLRCRNGIWIHFPNLVPDPDPGINVKLHFRCEKNQYAVWIFFTFYSHVKKINILTVFMEKNFEVFLFLLTAQCMWHFESQDPEPDTFIQDPVTDPKPFVNAASGSAYTVMNMPPPWKSRQLSDFWKAAYCILSSQLNLQTMIKKLICSPEPEFFNF
jgi:hypothetical protein